jgi:hypothetical protein
MIGVAHDNSVFPASIDAFDRHRDKSSRDDILRAIACATQYSILCIVTPTPSLVDAAPRFAAPKFVHRDKNFTDLKAAFSTAARISAQIVKLTPPRCPPASLAREERRSDGENA